MTAHRGVRAPLHAHCPRQRPFQSVPEANAIQNRIQHIGHCAVMAVFGVGVMPGVMTRGLQQSDVLRSEEHTSELQSRQYLVCRLLLEKKKKRSYATDH